MTLVEFLTVLIATYASIVSTFSVIYQFNDKRRKLKITSSYGFLAHEDGSSDEVYFIEIANVGHVPVTVYTPTIMLPKKKTLAFPYNMGEHGFPYELKPGSSTKMWILYDQLVNTLKSNGINGYSKLTAVVSDATGNKTKSKKKFKINLNWVNYIQKGALVWIM